MIATKPKALFRLKLTEIDSRKTKSITIYEGKRRKTLEQAINTIVQNLRANN